MKAGISIFLLILVIFADPIYGWKFLSGCSAKEEQSAVPSDSNEAPVRIDIEKNTQVDRMSRDGIVRYRTARVKKYANLKIYPDNYHPFIHPHSGIYGNVSEDAGWTGSASFFLSNPYLFVVVTYAGYATPVDEKLDGVRVEYAGGRIMQKHTGEAARRWFRELYKYEDNPGVFRLNTVNAYDAGFRYVFADLSRSVNIKAAETVSGNNIASSLYTKHGFYHSGRRDLNNLSPADPEAWLEILKKNSLTKIFIKLWKEKPSQISSAEDLGYLILIDPDLSDK
jgi:hypothetical protein